MQGDLPDFDCRNLERHGLDDVWWGYKRDRPSGLVVGEREFRSQAHITSSHQVWARFCVSRIPRGKSESLFDGMNQQSVFLHPSLFM